jgi:hypothetical protein
VLFAKSSPDQWSVLETLEHIMMHNHCLLLMITDTAPRLLDPVAQTDEPEFLLQKYTLDLPGSGGSDWLENISSILPDHLLPGGHVPPSEIRNVLRDQLHRCLCHLDLFVNGEGVHFKTRMPLDHSREMDGYQSLHFLAWYVKQHCVQLSSRIMYPVDWLVG